LTAAEQLADLRRRLAAYVEALRIRPTEPTTAAGHAVLLTREIIAVEIEDLLAARDAPAIAEPVFAFGERDG
jgi:hypothetical protein